MSIKNFLCPFLVLCLLSALPLGAAAKKEPVSKKTPVSKTSGKASKGKSSKTRRTSAARSAPRQSAPTPERYMEIQQALVDKGHHAGPVSGQWGAEWVEALKSFQESQSLKADGKLGALSLIALGLGPKREPLTQAAAKPESVR